MSRFVCSVSWLVFLLNTACLPPATAQERTGTISGVVTDMGHGVLKGASVDLQPAGKPTVTDSQGQFTITDLAPGEYRVLAWEDAEEGAPLDAEFRQSFESAAVGVRVEANGRETVSLKAISVLTNH